MYSIFENKTGRILERVFVVVVVIMISAWGVRALDDNFINDQDDSPCPENMAFVPSPAGGFCVDMYEASAGEDCSDRDPGSMIATRGNLDQPGCMPVTEPGAVPWRNISQTQAAAACAKAGKRLPTNKEWQQASLGTPDKDSSWTADDCQLKENWEAQPGKTGSAPACVSSAGAYDMIGNVWEWVDGTIRDGQLNGHDLPGGGYISGMDLEGVPTATDANPSPEYYSDFFWTKKTGVRGLARGGFWDNAERGGQYALYAEIEPSFAGTGVGFRCVR